MIILTKKINFFGEFMALYELYQAFLALFKINYRKIYIYYELANFLLPIPYKSQTDYGLGFFNSPFLLAPARFFAYNLLIAIKNVKMKKK